MSLFIVRRIAVTILGNTKIDRWNLFLILTPVINTFVVCTWISGIIYRYIKIKIIIFYHWFINDRGFDKAKIK